MKTSIFLPVFVMLLTNPLFGQITITSAAMPSANDTIRYSEASLDSNTLAVYQASGANVSWDFSQLTPESQGLEEYVSAFQTPYAFFFFGPNKYGRKITDSLGFGTFQFTDVYQFYNKTTSVYEVEGIGLRFQGLPLPSFYTDKDEIYQFPLDYGDVDSTTFAFNINFLTFGAYFSTGYRKNTVEGWGQVTTPYGTFDCLKVVTDIVSADSIAFAAFNFAFPNVQREIKWISNNEKIPVVRITGAVGPNGTFIPNLVTYRDIFRNITTPVSPLAPVVNFAASATNVLTTDTVTLASNSFLALHNWEITPNTVTFVNGTSSASQNAEVVFNQSGTYDVKLTVTNLFGSNDSTAVDMITVNYPVNTQNIFQQNEVKIFPNPVYDELFITYQLTDNQEVTLTLYDVNGKTITTFTQAEQPAGVYQKSFNLTPLNLAKGLYLLRLQVGKQHQTVQLLKQ